MDELSTEERLAKLREPFPANQISKLPKPTKKQSDDVKNNFKLGIRCQLCGGWHHKDVVHLDYVGHAALTSRLLDVDPHWNWEPVAFTPEGQPALDKIGGMWIKLTVCGQTRIGYGSADGKQGGDAIKEVIGDALRNAAMRFGAALDLWHKGQLHADEVEPDAELEGDKQAKSPSKDEAARNLYTRLERVIRAKKSLEALNEWGEDTANQDEILKLPKDWQQNIRNEFKAKRNELRKAARDDDDGFPGSNETNYSGVAAE